MILTAEEVRKVANLARLDLTEEEIEEYRRQLSDVLEYIEQLNELALDEVEPTARAVAQTNVWREDEVQPSLALQAVLQNAPAHKDDQFLIQSVLSND